MDNYLVLKLIHILSAVVLAGTGFGIAFFMLMANRSRNLSIIAATAKYVVIADWVFTTPAIFIQFSTGVWLMYILDYSFQSAWFLTAISLFILIGLCWIPVVFIQYQIRNIAQENEYNEYEEPALRKINKLIKIWATLGILAFSAILFMFWLMVFRPLPVTG